MSTGRGVILKGVADITGRAIGLVTFPIIARSVGAEGYGAYNQVTSLVSLVAPFAALGLGTGIVRFFAAGDWVEPVRRRLIRLALIAASVSAPAAICAMLFAPTLDRLFLNGWPPGIVLFRWGAPLILVGVVEQALLEFLRARQWLIDFSLFQLAEALLMGAAIVTLLPSGYGLAGVLQASIAIKAGVILAITISLWTHRRPHPTGSAGGAVTVWQMVQFGVPLSVAGFGLWGVGVGDRLVVGHFLTPASLGAYTAIYSMATLLLALNGPLLLPLYPRLMRAIGTNDRELAGREVRLFHRIMTLVLVPSVMFLVVMMRPLLLLLGGQEFSVEIWVVAPMVIAVFLDQWNAVAQYTVMCADDVKFSQHAWLTAAFLNIAANILIVPRFGLRGAAALTLATYAMLQTAFFLKASRSLPLLRLYRWDVMWRATTGSAAATAVVAWFFFPLPPRLAPLLFAAGLFGAIYVTAMVALGELGLSDGRILANAFYLTRRQAQ